MKTKPTANIGNITRLRIDEDGPGVRSVIFVCGCPLSCVWCCNPELCASKRFKTLTAEELYTYIQKDVLYFTNSGGGVTFSGGEPLLYTDLIQEFCEKYCINFSADMETSLYTERENLTKLIPWIDHWYIDFKVYDEKKHLAYTGVSNRIIQENLRYLQTKIGTERITVTYPMIPGYNTSQENISDMMKLLKEIGITQIDLHPYRKKQEQKHLDIGIKPTVIEEISKEEFQRIRECFLQNGFSIVQRTPYREKEKCRYLKEIRKKICKEYSISLEIPNCTFEGRCVGTCPQCERELAAINQWKSEQLGKEE